MALVMTAAPASAGAAVRTGTGQDPQGDVTSFSGAPIDLRSATVTYDPGAGTVNVAWTYYTDLSQVAHDDSVSDPGGAVFMDAPARINVANEMGSVNFSMTKSDPQGPWSVNASLRLNGPDALPGTATLSPDGHTVTADFAHPALAGHDWQRFSGSTGGDRLEMVYFDGFSPSPWPVAGDPTAPVGPAHGPDDSRVGMTISDGAQYTNDPDVTLSIIRPSWAGSLRVANDGGFRQAKTFSALAEIPWKLSESGSERLPKTVYLRFGSDAQTFTDDIILDQTIPSVTSARAIASGATARVAAASASRSHTYRVRISAKDATSGVAKVQFAERSKRHPAGLRAFHRISSYKGTRAPRYVRVRDRAGNYSSWRQVRG